MIKYTLHKNGWTVIINDVDLRDIKQADINQIAKLIATNTCVVFKKQMLTVEDELRILNMFKDPEAEYTPDDKRHGILAADAEKDPDGVLIRITGELRDGYPGGSGWNEEFSWHCDMPDDPGRRSIVWLYGVRHTAGSRTTWNNTVPAYKDLSDDIKNKISNLHSIYGNISPPDSFWKNESQINYEWNPPLVHRNIANQLGMYFSPLQLLKFVELNQEDSDSLKEFLFKHVTQEKYLYHHDWEDGDVVISEQWLGIHKRWAFDGMNKRLLHRAAIDFPDQDYTN